MSLQRLAKRVVALDEEIVAPSEAIEIPGFGDPVGFSGHLSSQPAITLRAAEHEILDAVQVGLGKVPVEGLRKERNVTAVSASDILSLA
ncbi:hypothetical protein CRI94_15480 [Longibacter salinarum]|uniref:Uncharacterized protein n=1 Tax=Longibacter salinarum TaxID=1850348 RepID=A0A2A8CUB9_9BACT|nr:hypothetical protein CRI94_15480 [Longibacter salinarum]